MYSDYTCLAKSSKHLQAINLGNKRGIGGCALLWKKSLDCSIKPLPGKGTDRICVVQLTIDSREYFIIGVYLPHQNCKIDNFKYELNILNDLCIEFNARGSTFLMGDTNCHFGAAYSNRSIGITTYHAGLFGNMLDACNMRAVDLSDIRTGPNHTWMSDNGSFTSYIDHMTVSEALMPYVTACKIIEDDILNVSDHLALKCSLKIRYTSVIANSEPKTAWHRATASDIALLYTQPLEEKIEVLLNDFNIEGETTVCWNGFERYQNIDIESVIRKLSQIMLDQSDLLPKSKYKKCLKPYWNKTLTDLNNARKVAVKNYINAGKPDDPGNELNIAYRNAKREFRAERRRAEFTYEKENMEKLVKTGEIDQRFFWWMVNKKSKRMFSPIYSDTGVLITQPDMIRNEWTSYFRDLFSEKIDPTWDSDFREYVNNAGDDINIEDRSLPDCEPVSEEEVCKQITKMANGKSPGWDNITLEHYKYSGEKGITIITWLINFVVFTEVPAYCKKNRLYPSPKRIKIEPLKTITGV